MLTDIFEQYRDSFRSFRPKFRESPRIFPDFGPVKKCSFADDSFAAMLRGMDRFDALILDALQQNARLTAEALSPQLGLSPDACRKRFARLRASGVIKAEIAVLDPAQVGRALILIGEITLQNEGPVKTGFSMPVEADR